MLINNFYIEIACNSQLEMGQMVCGDCFMQKEYPGHAAMVLCDGGCSGFKANVVAGVMSAMALTHTAQLASLVEVGRSVLRSFAGRENEKSPSITVIKITDKGDVSIFEYGNPLAYIFEGATIKDTSRVEYSINEDIKFYITEFSAKKEDRIIFITDGIEKSGFATDAMPTGWGYDGVSDFIADAISVNSKISAMELSNNIVKRSFVNDLGYPKRDMSCGSVYFRQPRKLLVCSGPPFDKQNDSVIAQLVDTYDGEVIISGGSTSQIISRELGRELSMLLKRDASGLPPTYVMDGVKLVTEGVLTLGRVKSVLEKLKESRAKGEGIDIVFVNELLNHDSIDFVVGTRINELHQNPNIPIELELRRSVVSDIARILETKYMKAVTKRYF